MPHPTAQRAPFGPAGSFTVFRRCAMAWVANDASYVAHFQLEQDNETVWRKSNIVEYLTDRPAQTRRAWLTENREAVLVLAPPRSIVPQVWWVRP